MFLLLDAILPVGRQESNKKHLEIQGFRNFGFDFSPDYVSKINRR
jgi:hypothetical protein